MFRPAASGLDSPASTSGRSPSSVSRCGDAGWLLRAGGHRRAQRQSRAALVAELNKPSLSTVRKRRSSSTTSTSGLVAESDYGMQNEAQAKLLKFMTGAQELRVVNYMLNGGILTTVFLLTLGASLTSLDGSLLEHTWDVYDWAVEAHPIVTNGLISGLVYTLGDLTAQTYEGRSFEDFDAARIIRSGVCGFCLHGPLSFLYYEALDRYFTVSAFGSHGDEVWVPVAKVAFDQTAWALSWNSLYYVALGALKMESPDVIASTIRTSSWGLLKAGWRLWPLVGFATFTVIPRQHRVLWVDMVELVWVTVLALYGQQRRLRNAAARVACALPGVMAREEIMRSMEVENTITFESAEGSVVTKNIDEVIAEAMLLEGSLQDMQDSLLVPADAE